MHRLPDALSRNPENREALNLARIGDWTKQREVIRGVQATITSGEFADDEPEPYVYNVRELGEPSTWEEFLSWSVAVKEDDVFRVQFFDSAGRQLHQEDITGVKLLKYDRFSAVGAKHNVAAVFVSRFPSEAYVYAAHFVDLLDEELFFDKPKKLPVPDTSGMDKYEAAVEWERFTGNKEFLSQGEDSSNVMLRTHRTESVILQKFHSSDVLLMHLPTSRVEELHSKHIVFLDRNTPGEELLPSRGLPELSNIVSIRLRFVVSELTTSNSSLNASDNLPLFSPIADPR
jgi:hypothetical protein